MTNHPTEILPSSRSIRARIIELQDKKARFLPHFMTMSEFLNRVCLVENFTAADYDTRVLLLLEASDFHNFKTLGIERNFFTFTTDSSYIFNFFSELAGEKISISSLESADTYAEYEEHLAILKTLYERYRDLCFQKHILDPIFLPSLYKINKHQLALLADIKIFVEGYLTNFEFDLLCQCSELIKVSVILNTTRFSDKTISKFNALGFDLKQEYEYELDIGNKKILNSRALKHNKHIVCFSFEGRIIQAAFVKKKIFDYINSGLKPHEIVVIVPDESFVKYLKLYDKENNLNFAMGYPFYDSDVYQYMDASCRYLDAPIEQNRARLLRKGTKFYEAISGIYYKNIKDVDFEGLVYDVIQQTKSSYEKKILNEELYTFLKLKDAYSDYNLKSVLHMFMQRLSKRTIDDVGGGKVTVMGLLESRNISFKGVIVVDFNDANVPKRIDKDMYLSSELRARANLPTRQDREDLQRHYYTLLFSRALHVSISCVHDEAPSRFLTQLGIPVVKIEDTASYMEILYKIGMKNIKPQEDEIVLQHDFTKDIISASSLKTLLECKRRYYYKYILSIKNHEVASDYIKEYEIGSDLHEVLSKIYTKYSKFDSKAKLQQVFNKEVDGIYCSTNLKKYQLELWKQKIDAFLQNEIDRFNSGFSVVGCEQKFTCRYENLKLSGQIDRIDSCSDGLYVLDYKSGKYPIYTAKNIAKATDFQLEFYYLFAQTLNKKILGCGYYDLNKGVVVDEAKLYDKLELLKKHLSQMQELREIDFCKTDDVSKCQYCEFVYMCGRA